MLKDWFHGKIQSRALHVGAREVEKFAGGFKAMGDRDIGAIVAIATVIRINLETHGVIGEGVFHRRFPALD